MGLRVNPATLLPKAGNSPLIVSEERSPFAGEPFFHLTHTHRYANTQTHTTTSPVLLVVSREKRELDAQ